MDFGRNRFLMSDEGGTFFFRLFRVSDWSFMHKMRSLRSLRKSWNTLDGTVMMINWKRKPDRSQFPLRALFKEWSAPNELLRRLLILFDYLLIKQLNVKQFRKIFLNSNEHGNDFDVALRCANDDGSTRHFTPGSPRSLTRRSSTDAENCRDSLTSRWAIGAVKDDTKAK